MPKPPSKSKQPPPTWTRETDAPTCKWCDAKATIASGHTVTNGKVTKCPRIDLNITSLEGH